MYRYEVYIEKRMARARAVTERQFLTRQGNNDAAAIVVYKEKALALH